MWEPDILGPPFRRLTLDLGADDEGPTVATLVRYAPDDPGEAEQGVTHKGEVLYIHGWSDYFFQAHLARFWHGSGFRFFALDLRKHGRSLRPGQTPGLVADLATYDADIEAALTAMSELGGSRRPPLLMGHSTGGLTLSLWADRHPGAAAGLVLNSPWLEFQGKAAGRVALAPVLALQARHRPLAPLPNVDLGYYTRTVSSRYEGTWDYDLAWRPERGFATNPAWLNAVLSGHDQVARGLHIDVPVLVLLSARSILSAVFSPEMASADVAIDVDVVATRATRLGPLVTIVRLDGAVHDVFLSRPAVRRSAYQQIEHWLRGYVVA